MKEKTLVRQSLIERQGQVIAVINGQVLYSNFSLNDNLESSVSP